MTSRERLLASYAHKPVDRIPCSPRMAAWMLDHYGNGESATYLKAQQEFGFDIHTMCDPFRNPLMLGAGVFSDEATGVEGRQEERTEGEYRVVRRTFQTPDGTLSDETRFPPAGDRRYGVFPNPVRTEYLVKDRSDLKALRRLLEDPDRAVPQYFQDVEREIGDSGLVMFQVCSSLCHRAGDAYHFPDLMVLYYDDRAFFDELLALCRRTMMEELEVAIRAGVKHFFGFWYYNSLSAGWSPAMWRECFKAELADMMRRIHAAGGTLNLYDDGKVMPILDDLAECGIDVLQTLCPPPMADVDLAEAKRRIGDRVCLWGYVDLVNVIQRGTPALIERTVREAIETAGPTGFVLGSSDSIRDGTPVENVRAYFDAARKYGSL